MNNELVWYENTVKNSSQLYVLEAKDDKKKYEHYSEDDNSNIYNLTDLTYVNIPSIINVLNKRYENNDIYTFNGNIVISINPFKTIDIYRNITDINTEIPHIYSLAEMAYLNIEKKNQSILVSGESGSGKTENTKYILKYLCLNYAINENLGEKIIQSNYLIELFGNAKTIRNDNSSRFGKFIKLFISDKLIIGGQIDNYLLEKSRISMTNKDEKSYHIFYLICNDSQIREKYGIKEIDYYNVLKMSNFKYLIEEFNNSEQLFNVFRQFDFTDIDIDNIFYKLRLVLELLNCNSRDDLRFLLDNYSNILDILDINKELLFDNLTTKIFTISGETIIKNLDKKEIRVQIKSYCEDLYEDMFNGIIFKINSNLGENTQSYISILDIFGFEIFDNNGFEQLCINYTNEVLQQIYNEYIFQNEQNEYEKEEIDWTKINFRKNDEIVDLFIGRQSIFSIINEQSILGSGTNRNIFIEIERSLKGNLLDIKKSKRIDNIFNVAHYTGDVEYQVLDYIEKNRIKSKSKKIKTNLQYFTHQLEKLKNELDKNKCYFIRCIKPNDKNIAGNFDQIKIYNQLLYSGIIEGIKIVLSGYPIKKQKKELIKEFRFFNYFENNNILEYLGKNETDLTKYQIGKSKVFLKKSFYEKYCKVNQKYKEQLICEVQRFVKTIYIRKNFIAKYNAIYLLQRNIRIKIANEKIRILRINKLGLILTKNIMRNKVRDNYILMKKSVNTIKAYSFINISRRSYQIYKRKIEAGIVIYTWYMKLKFNNKIKNRRDVKELQKNVEIKNNIIEEKETLINEQDREIKELRLLLRNSNINPDIVKKTDIINNNIENKDSPQLKIKESSINHDYYENKKILTKEEEIILNDNKLEDIGVKIHDLYEDLTNKQENIELMEHKYRVLLLAYEREKNKNSSWTLFKKLFSG